MISIVMAYYNRLEQIPFTLKTINMSDVPIEEVEIIVVDDGSAENNRLDKHDIQQYSKYPVKVIRIERETKRHMNPCIPYNIGFREAVGDMIVIQNPECCHIGDVLRYVKDTLKDNDYISFGCYGMNDLEHNKEIYNIYNSNRSVFYDNVRDLILSYSNKEGTTALFSTDVGGWLNNDNNFKGYHYLSAIKKTDLDKLGGFDEEYANGICYDDDDLIRRISFSGLQIKYPDIITNIRPFAIHQWHPKSESLTYNTRDSWLRNTAIFQRKMANLGISREFPYTINFESI